MARIDGAAEPHIKEDGVITIITIEDAIRDIIALLVLILFCTLTKAEQKQREEDEAAAAAPVALILNLCCSSFLASSSRLISLIKVNLWKS